MNELYGTYILNPDHTFKKCEDQEEFLRFFADIKNRIIKQDDIYGFKISTVFLCLDHNFKTQNDPILFETIVFDRNRDKDSCADVYMTHGKTYEEALEMHQRAIEWVRGHE